MGELYVAHDMLKQAASGTRAELSACQDQNSILAFTNVRQETALFELNQTLTDETAERSRLQLSLDQCTLSLASALEQQSALKKKMNSENEACKSEKTILETKARKCVWSYIG
jgi:uncharacterized coiled-coil protein SlyX